VLVPANAFKNPTPRSSAQNPSDSVVPDLLDLYNFLNAYIERPRGVLLAGARGSRYAIRQDGEGQQRGRCL